MRALRADGEDLFAAAHQQNGLAFELADEHAAIGKFCFSDPSGQIGEIRIFLMLSHFILHIMPAFFRATFTPPAPQY
ncbi:hypothetical protein GCM10019059_30250 [Camelimonas fluminis]|nr:hypothetical protein GCM10019059_30250 [Camelimonas fluminis]